MAAPTATAPGYSRRTSRFERNLIFILAGTAIATTVYGLAGLFIFPLSIVRKVMVLVLLLVCLASWMMTRKGRTMAAAYVMVLGTWVVMSASAFLMGGVDTVGFRAYLPTILIAGLLLGGKPAITLAACSATVGCFLVILQGYGLLPEADFVDTPVARWISGSMVFGLSAVVLYLATDQLSDALSNLRNQTRRLLKSENRAMSLFRAIPDMIVRCNSDLEIIDIVSPSGALRPADTIDPDKKSIFEQHVREIANASKSLSGHVSTTSYTLRLDGKLRAFEARTVREAGDTFICLIRDVTEGHLVRQELADKERRLQAVFDHTDGYLAILNPEGKIEYVNRAGTEATGLHQDSAFGLSITDAPWWANPDEDEQVLRSALTAALRGISTRDEAAFKSSSGELRAVARSVKPVFDEDSSVTSILVEGRDITELVRAYEHVEESEKRFRELYDSLPLLHITTSRDGRIVSANIQACKLLQRSPESMMGTDVDILLPGVAGHIESGNESKPLELIVETDAGLRWLRLNIGRGESTDGSEVFHFIGEDTTERKQAESEARMLAHAVRSTGECVVVTDLENKVIFVNRAFIETYGYERSELYGRQIDDILRSYSPFAETPTMHSETLRGGWQGEVLNRRKDGSIVTAVLSTSPILDEHGEAVALFGVETNLSEARRAELLNRTILETTRDGFWISDSSGVILEVNESYCELSGYSREELVGMHVSELGVDTSIDDTMEHIKRVRHTGQDLFEALHRTKDGRVLNIEVSVNFLNVDGGRFCAFLRDITDRKRAVLEIRRLNAELEERVTARTLELKSANFELESFAYSVSHDLRAPLRAIGGFAEIILRRHRDELNEEGRRYFDYIVSAASKMDRFINDLLAYSRLGRQAVRREPVVLTSIIDRVLQNLASKIQETGAKIHVSPDLGVALGDDTLIEQIVQNLVDNALTYHLPETQPHISIRSVRSNGSIVCEVADQGIGIDPDHFDQIFNMFERLHSDAEFPGTGIGLAMVKKAANTMGGSIVVMSAPGDGSTFSVTLPSAAV